MIYRFLVTTSEETRYLPFGPIIFDIEQIDTKNSFNINDGVFTVPESGLYLFTFNGYVNTNIYGVVYVYVNGNRIKYFYDYEGTGKYGRELTFFVSLELQQYDELYLDNGYASSLYVTDDHPMTFLGTLLK